VNRPPHVSFPVRTQGRRPSAADLVASVLAEIKGGRLPAGSRLPPVRVLEQQLGMSKNTAQAA
jgi:DNA-binding FadR family transcriptional regulator